MPNTTFAELPRSVYKLMPEDKTDSLDLQFARQLYERFLERYGEDHEQTRLVLGHISALENRTGSGRG
jgi:hypothetical protein